MPSTTVFQSGNSQAVRLPKEFRFKSKTVEIFRRGDEVVLRERKRSLGEAINQAFADLPPMTAQDRRDFDAAMALAKERRPVQERDWARMFGGVDEKLVVKAPARRGRTK
jgi:antitoxin VapB